MSPSASSAVAAARELGDQLGVDGEAVGHGQQLLVELAQQRLGHRAHGGAEPVPLALGTFSPSPPVSPRLVTASWASRSHFSAEAISRSTSSRVSHALVDQLLRVQLADRRVRLDRAAHHRLRVGRLVELVVAQAAIPDQVDQHVALVAAAVGGRDLGGADAGVDVVGVDVDHGHVVAAGQVADVVGRARVVGVGGEADLVVGDDVHRAAGAVAAQRLQVERLGHDALAGEGRVAVDEDGHRRARVVVRRRRSWRSVWQRAGEALGDGVDLLEVARVGRELDAHRAAVARGVGALGAQVVLDVAGGLAGVLVARLECHVALELGEDRLGRAPDHAGDEGEPAAVGHADHDVVGALVGRPAR